MISILRTNTLRKTLTYTRPTSTFNFNRFKSSSSSASFSDPNRNDIYYHLFDPPTPLTTKSQSQSQSRLPAYALSFSSSRPPSVYSKINFGWLPGTTTTTGTGTTDSGTQNQSQSKRTQESGLNDFIHNPEFLDILHKAVKEVLRKGTDEILKANAMQMVQGWMHINDQRNIPALNRVGDPEDIIGSVLVENSQILPETYQPMPSYRLVTSDGPIQLTEGLYNGLIELFEVVAEEERQQLQQQGQQQQQQQRQR